MHRRIVTGERPNGTSFIASDDNVQPRSIDLNPGALFTQLWSTESTPIAPVDGRASDTDPWFPGESGFRFFTFSLPPDGSTDGPNDPDHAVAIADQQIPGILDAEFDDAEPGRHRSLSVDVLYVVSGAITLIVDDGDPVTAMPGDTIVQNGTFHNWSVPGPEPVVLVAAAIGLRRGAETSGSP